MRRVAKQAFYAMQRQAVLVHSALRGTFKPSTDKFVIFALHTVAPSTSDMAVSGDRLREQLAALDSAGYRCLSLPELLRAMQHPAPLASPAYALTFDDGYRSVYTEAWPILRELGLTATLFLTVDFLDGKTAPPWGSTDPALVAEYSADAEHFQPLTWSQAQELASSDEFTIGSHSMSHPLMARLEPEMLHRELTTSKSELESRLDKTIEVFAYPYGVRRYGAFSPTTEESLRSSYVASFTSEIGRARVGTGPFMLPRMSLTNTDGPAEAVAKAAGAYDWVRLVQGAFHKIMPNPHVTSS